MKVKVNWSAVIGGEIIGEVDEIDPEYFAQMAFFKVQDEPVGAFIGPESFIIATEVIKE